MEEIHFEYVGEIPTINDNTPSDNPLQELREMTSKTIDRELFFSVQNNLKMFPFLYEEAKKI
jgi:hypothetical protein